MRYVVGNEDVEAMRLAGAPRQYSDARNPLLTLVRELSQREDCRQIYVRKNEFLLKLEKRK
jgi:hypothetical protein